MNDYTGITIKREAKEAFDLAYWTYHARIKKPTNKSEFIMWLLRREEKLKRKAIK